MNKPYDLVVLGGGIVGIWTALRAERQGLRVAILEIGPASLSEREEPRPPIHFPERVNQGAIEARNHVMTGNSPFWGGGLVRNPPEDLAGLFGPLGGQAVESFYPEIESILGIRPQPKASTPPSWAGHCLLEVVVLPGRRRGLWRDFLGRAPSRAGGILVFERADILGVDRSEDGRLLGITFSQRSGVETRIEADWFSLSMGAVDSIHFVQQHMSGLLGPSARGLVGTGMHDHWSVPIARIHWKNGTAMQSLFPPKFGRGGIVGRRIPLPNGFLHITANYDAIPPYDKVKKFLSLRQEKAKPGTLLQAACSTLSHPWLMLKAGLHYLANHELFVRDGESVTLTLDFESAADPENRLVSRPGQLDLHWDLRIPDEIRFHEILEGIRPWIETQSLDDGAAPEWLVPNSAPRAVSEYLRANARDAYHLGGGLQPELANEGISHLDGTLTGCSNLLLNTSAVFNRPGQANPVLTLLARANQLIDRLAPQEASR